MEWASGGVGTGKAESLLRQDHEEVSTAEVVLIADDDEFFRMALRVILIEKLGFSEVVEAQSLDDAVEKLSDRHDIGLALFDLSMPGMKSAASLRAVRECFRDVRIAVVSGSQRREDILLALSSGVHGFVPKSEGVALICRALKMIVNGLIFVPSAMSEIDDDDRETFVGYDHGPRVTLNALTPRQRDVLELLVEGKSNKEIARSLDLGEGTVKVHISALFRSLGTSSRSAAAVSGAKLLSQ